MPIYEYRCNACGHKLESLQRLSDAPLVTCPACGKDTLAKQLSAAGFQLKGSGWYATDFKNSGSKPPAKDAAKPDAKADAPAGASSEASETKSSDTSTAAKADAPAAPAATKTSDQGKSETRGTSDKPAATGTTSGSS
jgi:putative FmdB family regulatory protein